MRRAPVRGLSQALPAGGGAGIGGPTSEDEKERKINIFIQLETKQ